MFRVIASLSVAAVVCAPACSRTACPEHFAAGQSPTIINLKRQPRTQEVCFESFAVLHSGISRTPLYSAEHLTRQNLESAKTLSRRDSFHPDRALPVSERAELHDYARSGFDRGHMSPNGKMPNRSAQAESFSLANMVPQVHMNNAGVWAGIEGAARQMAISEGELYVVSGPAFLGGEIQQIGNVLVPTHLWKVLYSPRQRRAGAYLITNDETRAYSAVTVSDLEKMIGVSLLPGLPQKIRDAGMDLPKPSSTRGKKRQSQTQTQTRNQVEEQFLLRDLRKIIMGAINRANR